jgi:hypothetical protein
VAAICLSRVRDSSFVRSFAALSARVARGHCGQAKMAMERIL